MNLALFRYPWLQEIISRSNSNQWYASRRQHAHIQPTHLSPNHPQLSSDSVEPSESVLTIRPTFYATTAASKRLAFLEAGNEQASLVDVDSELGTLLRQTVW